MGKRPTSVLRVADAAELRLQTRHAQNDEFQIIDVQDTVRFDANSLLADSAPDVYRPDGLLATQRGRWLKILIDASDVTGLIANTFAATVIVKGGGTETELQAAIDALPAGGGVIYFEGTYNIGVTLTLSDKPVKFIGSGRGSAIINLGASAIAAFTIGFDNEYTFASFTILGTDIAGQQGFRYTLTGTKVNSFSCLDVGRSGGTEIERVISASGATISRLIHAYDVIADVRVAAAGRLIETLGTFRATSVKCSGSAAILSQAGLADGPKTVAVNCIFSNGSGGFGSAFGVNSFISGCELINGGSWRLKGKCTISGGHLSAGSISTLTGGENTITGLVSDSISSPQIDLSSLGTGDNIVANCTLAVNGANAAIRVASVNNNVVTGNRGGRVVETGTADFNHYSNNEGFDGSTIIGPDSVADDANVRTVTTTPVTLDLDDRTVDVDSSGGVRLVNLPPVAVALYKIYTVKKLGAANTVTLDGDGAETIDGVATVVMTDDNDVITIQAKATGWRVLSRGSAAALSAAAAHAATVVVDPAGNGDATTIQGGVDALPAAGGKVYLKAATYLLAATVTMPDKPVRITGASIDSVIIDVQANAIAAFTIAFDNDYAFEHLRVQGNGAAVQEFIEFTGATVAGVHKCRIDSCEIEDVDDFIQTVSSATPHVIATRTEVIISTITGRLWAGIVGSIFEASDCIFTASSGAGGGFGTVELRWTNVLYDPGSSASISPRKSTVIGCRLLGGSWTLTLADDSFFSHCEFATVQTTALNLNTADRTVVIGCTFVGFITRAILVQAGADNCVIVGNRGCLINQSAGSVGCVFANNEGSEDSTYNTEDTTVIDGNSIRTITSGSTSLNLRDRTVQGDSSAGDATALLPAAAGSKHHIYTIVKTAAGNAVIIDANAGELIGGALTIKLTELGDFVTIQCTGTGWEIIARNLGVLSDTTVVGNVGAGIDDLMSLTIPLNSFRKNGDMVRVKAWGQTVNNANVKTLRWEVGAGVLMTTILTANQAGFWEVEAVFIRTGLSTQDFQAKLIEFPGTLHDMEQGTDAETETADIIVKMTADATADNDITQEGMTMEILN